MSFIRLIEPQELPQWTAKKGGRRWRSDDHMIGNDAKEAARLEMEHDLFKLAFLHNYFAPLFQPKNVLDVACGIGLWDLELLKQFPHAHLMALDIDPVLFKHFLQKPRARPFYPHLERLTFVQADATKAFPFENGTFDFTHSRIPDTFLSEENWPQLIREMTRVTQSGGWVEIVAAGHMETEYPSEIIDALLHAEIQMCQAINLAPAGAPGLLRYLQEAGITTYNQRIHTKGKTTKERHLLIKDMKHVLAGTGDLLVKFGILTEAQVDRYLAQFEQEALRAGLVMRDVRVWFQPQAQRHGQLPAS